MLDHILKCVYKDKTDPRLHTFLRLHPEVEKAGSQREEEKRRHILIHGLFERLTLVVSTFTVTQYYCVNIKQESWLAITPAPKKITF